MDLAYGTRPTAFVAAARRAGIAAADGRGMLLHQGALAFEAWYSRPAPLGVMREALAAALG
jgi:shikimate dehydrogenase